MLKGPDHTENTGPSAGSEIDGEAITLAQQRRQLEDTGFLPDAVAFDCRGRRIADDTTLDSMALIARKL